MSENTNKDEMFEYYVAGFVYILWEKYGRWNT
jgi:hypothetical protein